MQQGIEIPAYIPLSQLRDATAKSFLWRLWDDSVKEVGVTIIHPRLSRHPVYSNLTYPTDYVRMIYNFGAEDLYVDVFVGTAKTGLVAAIATHDFRTSQREMILLYNCIPEEVSSVGEFINSNPQLVKGFLIMREEAEKRWPQPPPDFLRNL